MPPDEGYTFSIVSATMYQQVADHRSGTARSVNGLAMRPAKGEAVLLRP